MFRDITEPLHVPEKIEPEHGEGVPSMHLSTSQTSGK
jgi:hypothetical protein